MLVGSLLLGTSIAAADSKVTFEEGFPEITGALDADSIHNVIKPRFDDFKQCYAKRLAVKPALSGTVLVAFVIAPDGHVDSATGVGVDVDVAGCIAAEIKRLSFAKPKDGSAAAVAYPFMLHAADNTNAPPKVAVDETGELKSNGDLDKEIIRRYIKRDLQKIQYCYEKELLVKPGLAGTLVVQFFIAPDGKVNAATGAGVNANVADCVAGVIKSIEFPKPKGGGGVQVNYPFTFKTTDGTPSVVPSVEESGASKSTGDLDKAIIRRYIKRNVQKIQYCYEKYLLAKPNIEGTITAEFFITSKGTVDRSTATGFDKDVADCVAGVLKTIEFPQPKGTEGVQVSYPFTFKQGRGAASKPTTPSSGGTLDRADITATIKNEMPKVKACYDKRVAVKPGISGTIKVVFFVTPNGTVDPSIATGFDQGVADCVASVIKAAKFPKPTGGGVQISYPFVF